jgi:uncharacterized protein (DUF302 family)
MFRKFLSIGSVIFLCFGVGPVAADTAEQEAVDSAIDSVGVAVASAGLKDIVAIDHSRLAAAEGVPMPPAHVQIFSDSVANSAILQANIRAGLDLPFRILSYSEKGTPSLAYTSSDFIAKRHGINDQEIFSAFEEKLDGVLSQLTDLPEPKAAPVGADKDFGVLELVSNYDVPETVARIRKAVTAQPDTVWFAEIDFQAEARESGVDIAPAQLLLFGGPAPGGVAMAEFPAIGLDAFCQKLLVYRDDQGNTRVIFNDIAAFAELHYGSSAKPHAMLNKRLTKTFSTAIQ